jgi:hypothetical protein
MSYDLSDTIKAVQHAVGADVDGIAGADTWSRIAKALKVEAIVALPKDLKIVVRTLGDELVSIALAQLGTQEDKAHTNRGAEILKYQQATDLGGQGWPWCSAFVCWCVWQLLQRHADQLGQFVRPRTAAAFGLIEWGREHGCKVFGADIDDPQPGDLVVYTFHHCGIVRDVDLQHRTFHAIEGNSNDDGSRDGYEVVNHLRNFSSVGKFIRLPLGQQA